MITEFKAPSPNSFVLCGAGQSGGIPVESAIVNDRLVDGSKTVTTYVAAVSSAGVCRFSAQALVSG